VPPIPTTALDIARRFLGHQEIPGAGHSPFIQWCFTLCGYGPETPDEVAWCSAFAQAPAFLLGLPRSKSAAARSWLQVGSPVDAMAARPGFDVVVLKRGQGAQPGPEILNAPGHVGFFAGWTAESNPRVRVCGGNQSDSVSEAIFPAHQILSIRRLA
jgi:uncharacterized protein (TIGR02594 family)